MDINTIIIVVSALAAISEGLALIPGIKSNSLFQLVYFIIRSIVNGIRSKEV